MRHRVDVSVVMPVYNEQERVRGVVTAWCNQLTNLGIRSEVRVYDDGSSDATSAILAELAGERSEVMVIRQENRGHGPTVLRGYREAGGDWVLQVDGDGGVDPRDFTRFWAHRDSHDMIVGYRHARGGSIGRRVLTLLARLGVLVAFGETLRDVNSPYRLIRRDPLHRLIAMIPPGTFAPNVALSGLACSAGLRILQLRVAATPVRRAGRHVRNRRVYAGAVRAMAQTVRIAVRHQLMRWSGREDPPPAR